MRLLLLDMDNVLLEPGGYRRALQYTVVEAGRSLGYRSPHLSNDEIEEIEACGVTSEWEMSAICAAVMMDQNRRDGQETALPEALPPGIDRPDNRQAPSFIDFFRRLAALDSSQSALERAGGLLMDGKTQQGINRGDPILQLLQGARTADAVTFRTIQELVLGSDVYSETYRRPALLAAPSYLDQYDRSNLSAELAGDLRRWLEQPDRRAVIFTNRPNRPPAGHHDTPEAELGAKLIGLENLPIVGSGDMAWLSNRHSRNQGAFLKPSPVHALTGFLLAAGRAKPEAMLAAHGLAEQAERKASVWEGLAGADVTIFEDSRGGMDSARSARELLSGLGIEIGLHLAGVARSRAKAKELHRAGATVFPSFERAVRELILP